MILLSTTDYLVILVYLVGIAGVSVIFRAKQFKHMFGEEKKPSWLLLAASLLMIKWSPMTDMMSMGLILDNGYSGMWMLKSRFWLAGVPAILYATMWSRLVMQTDNEPIRLRFSGPSGMFLHVFRAIFLALFVIPLFGSFIILAIFIWQFKFGDFTVAIALLLVFVGLVGYVYRSMSVLLGTRVSSVVIDLDNDEGLDFIFRCIGIDLQRFHYEYREFNDILNVGKMNFSSKLIV